MLLAALFASLLGAAARADSPAAPPSQPASVATSWRLGAERLRLPAGETVGLVGAALQFGLDGHWWVGPVVFGAASGQRGGLFVIGGDALWRAAGPAGSRIEAGLTIGGGGGAAAPVGSGLMIRPHLGWSWPLGPGWIGVSAARVRFPSGRIDSSQLGLFFSVDDRFRHVAAGSPAIAVGTRSGLGFDRVWLNGGRYRGADGAGHGYAGIRADHWLGPTTYLGIEAAGAAQGGADGYAELLAGAGAEWPLGRSAAAPSIGLRGALGLGGGGAVDTGGGTLVKLAATLRWQLPNDLLLGVEAGRTVAPAGRFRASHLQLSLGVDLDRPAASGRPPGAPRNDDLEWSAVLAHLPRMRYRDGSVDAVQTVGLRVRRPLDRSFGDHLQLAAGLHFAAGGHAGAYGAGLIGIGLATPLQQPGWQWGAELLAGAAGGGGIDARGGAVLQPMARLGWASGAQRWQLGVGQLRAVNGGLSSAVIEFSYGAAIGLPRR